MHELTDRPRHGRAEGGVYVPPADNRLIGLDGLRAIAVSSVFLYHLEILHWARGGFLGVDLFFVISGFLITGLLAGESERKGQVNLLSFYWRRAKRLLPASWLMMIAAIVAAVLFAPDAVPRLRWDSIASFFYVTNWELLYAQRSYFETMGREPLLQHLWSLAIEEQFYIVWAPIIFLLMPRIGRAGMAVLALALAVASATWMAVLCARMGYAGPGTGDPTRLYFGTDTHGFMLLFGAVLGLVWQPNKPARRAATTLDSVAAWLAGLTALAVTLYLMATMGDETPWLYPWGFLIAAAAAIVLIMASTYRGASFGSLIDAQPLKWIGERSYGIYLWHWPIFMLTRPDLDLDLDETTVFIIRVTLTLVLSALSYRYVEQPIRHGWIDQAWDDLSDAAKRGWARTRLTLAGLVTAGAFATAAAVFMVAPAEFQDTDVVAEETADQGAEIADATPPVDPAPSGTPDTGTPPVETPAPTPNPDTPPVPPTVPAVPEEDGYTGDHVVAVGDSVMLGSKYVFDKVLPGIDLHAEVGWQATDIIREMKALIDGGKMRDVVVLHVGTNGYVTEDQFNKLFTMLADRKRVVIVSLHAPRRWIEPNNDLIHKLMPNYPNVVLADWAPIADAHKDLFAKDGVHPKPAGQRLYVAEIMRAGHLVSPPPPPPPPPKPKPGTPSAKTPDPAKVEVWLRKYLPAHEGKARDASSLH